MDVCYLVGFEERPDLKKFFSRKRFRLEETFPGSEGFDVSIYSNGSIEVAYHDGVYQDDVWMQSARKTIVSQAEIGSLDDDTGKARELARKMKKAFSGTVVEKRVDDEYRKR